MFGLSGVPHSKHTTDISTIWEGSVGILQHKLAFAPVESPFTVARFNGEILNLERQT